MAGVSIQTLQSNHRAKGRGSMAYRSLGRRFDRGQTA